MMNRPQIWVTYALSRVAVLVSVAVVAASFAGVAFAASPGGGPTGKLANKAYVEQLLTQALSTPAGVSQLSATERSAIEFFFVPGSVDTSDAPNATAESSMQSFLAPLSVQCGWHWYTYSARSTAGNLLYQWQVTTYHCWDSAANTVSGVDSYGEDLNNTQFPWAYEGEQVDSLTYAPDYSYFNTYNKAKYDLCLAYCFETDYPWAYKSGYPDGYVATAWGLD